MSRNRKYRLQAILENRIATGDLAMHPKVLGPMTRAALVRRFDPVPVVMMSLGVLLGAMLVLVF